ncbi:MAG: hypothetical protein IPL61_25575 [Myxococcales bacterium]|nr:hypothetical protein [Myxococcales bacterium]
MRSRLIPWALVAATACGFQPSGATTDGGDDDGPANDAPVADGGGPDGPTIDALAIDAAAIDALGIDAATSCPVDYTAAVGASRYVVRTLPTSITLARADCDDDLPGRTHLATLEDGDLEAVLTAAGANPSREIYLAAECNTTGSACDVRASWVWRGGVAAVDPALWKSGEPLGGFEFAYAARGGNAWELLSSAGFITREYLCECGP